MFYCFDQNNSGGSFHEDDRVCQHVIIEADSAGQANELAEDLGIYFDGCDQGIDCSCCGDRWYPAWDDGDQEPNIYGKDPAAYKPTFSSAGAVYCRVFYQDGLIKEYRALGSKQKAIK
jgi:hypothetical protein